MIDETVIFNTDIMSKQQYSPLMYDFWTLTEWNNKELLIIDSDHVDYLVVPLGDVDTSNAWWVPHEVIQQMYEHQNETIIEWIE